MLNRILGRVLAGAAMVAALAAVPAVAEEQFSLARFGGAAAGQSVATVQRALRDDLAPIDGNADPECHFRQAARRFPNLRIMVEKGVVTRFDTKDPQYATSAGVRVGDTVERVKAAYGPKIRGTQHQIDPKGLLLTIYNTEHTIGLVFEAHGGTVTEIRSGRVPAVDYVHGCPW